MSIILPPRAPTLAGVTYTTILSRDDEDLAQELKRRLLLLDRIYMNPGFHPAFLHPDMKWLAEQQVVTLIKPDLGSLVDEARRSGFEAELTGDLATIEDNLTRVWAGDISQDQGVDTVPLCWFDKPRWPQLEGAATPSVGRAVEILLKAIPLPGPQVSLEDVLSFRNDEDVRRKLTRLRFWMRRVAREERKASEIAEELEETLFEYEQAMRLHRLKYEKGVLRTVLTTTAEVADNLLRLKFKPLVDAIFSVSDQRLKLLEAEESAPGKEVAYVFATRRRFGET